MRHKTKVTVLDTKLYSDYKQQYSVKLCYGKYTIYEENNFIFFRDDYWHYGFGTTYRGYVLF